MKRFWALQVGIGAAALAFLAAHGCGGGSGGPGGGATDTGTDTIETDTDTDTASDTGTDTGTSTPGGCACACETMVSANGCADFCSQEFDLSTTPNFCEGVPASPMCATCLSANCPAAVGASCSGM